jgi:hypothetical protein
MIWWIILGMLISALCFIAYLIMFAPLMPDDYDLKEDDIWPLDEKPIKYNDGDDSNEY